MAQGGATPAGGAAAAAATTPGGSGRSGDQSRQGGGGGRGRRNNSNNRPPSRPAFKSPIPELEGHTFSCGSTGYDKAIEGIAAWATSTEGMPYECGAALRQMAPPALDGPDYPADETDTKAMFFFKEAHSAHMKKLAKIEQAMMGLFHTLLGQCDDFLKGKLRNRSDFKTLEAAGDTIGLAKAIEEEGYSLRKSEYPPFNAWKALQRLSKTVADREGRMQVGEFLDGYAAASALLDRSAGPPGAIRRRRRLRRPAQASHARP